MFDTPPATECWTLGRGRQTACCLARPHPFGVEMRYLVNGHPLISRVFVSWEAAMQQAGLWREGLEARGWTTTVPLHPPTPRQPCHPQHERRRTSLAAPA